jgi:ABC-2 type transport system ATP-binding protein
MTGLDNLKFFARIYRIKNYKEKINQITTTLGINHKLKEYVSNYSRGQKLRIAISRVLLIEPEVLFLDEPTAGLDPKTTNEIIDFLKNLNLSILFTSHQMEVVSKLCNSIAFLKKGNIIKIDSTENFKSIFTNKVKVQVSLLNKKEQLIRELNTLDFVSDVSQKDSFITFYLTDNTFFPKLFDFLKNYSIISINEIKPSLEDVFIKLVD